MIHNKYCLCQQTHPTTIFWRGQPMANFLIPSQTLFCRKSGKKPGMILHMKWCHNDITGSSEPGSPPHTCWQTKSIIIVTSAFPFRFFSKAVRQNLEQKACVQIYNTIIKLYYTSNSMALPLSILSAVSFWATDGYLSPFTKAHMWPPISHILTSFLQDSYHPPVISSNLQ